MKKIVVALVLAAGIGGFAYANFSNHNRKPATEKKTEKKEKKKECRKYCMFS